MDYLMIDDTKSRQIRSRASVSPLALCKSAKPALPDAIPIRGASRCGNPSSGLRSPRAHRVSRTMSAVYQTLRMVEGLDLDGPYRVGPTFDTGAGYREEEPENALDAPTDANREQPTTARAWSSADDEEGRPAGELPEVELPDDWNDHPLCADAATSKGTGGGAEAGETDAVAGGAVSSPDFRFVYDPGQWDDSALLVAYGEAVEWFRQAHADDGQGCINDPESRPSLLKSRVAKEVPPPMSGRAEAHDGGLGPSREHTGAARGGGWDEGGDDFDQDQWEEDEPGVDDWEEDQGFDDAAGFEGGYPHQGSYPDAWAYPERYPAHAQSYGSPFGYPSTSYGFGCGGWEAPWGPPPPPPPHAWGPRPGPFHSPPPMPHMGWGSPGWPGWGTTGGLPWESPPPPSPHRSKAGAGKRPAPKPRADSLEIEEIAEQTAQSLLGSHDMRRIRATLLAFFEAGLDTFTS